MDPNRFYCRDGGKPATSASSNTSVTSSGNNGGSSSTMQDYLECGSSSQSATAFNGKDLYPKNTNSKLVSQRGPNGNGLNSSGSSISGYCGSSSGTTGNYINVTPVPLGTMQYPRRKPTPQEYQSRLYYNTTDYRNRDDFYSLGGANRINSTTSSSLQIHNQPQQQQQQQQQQQPHIHNQSQHPQHAHPQSHQQQQVNHSLNHPQQSHQGQHRHQFVGSSNAIKESVDEMSLNRHNHAVVATQTNIPDNTNCEQPILHAPISLGTLTVPIPPMMYTVHRVVTTAQIQTTGGNTFAASSSVSSVASAVRNEANGMAVLGSSNSGDIGSGDSTAIVGETDFVGDCVNSSMNETNIGSGSGSGTEIRSSPGQSTNTSYLTHQPKCSGISEAQPHSSGSRISNNNYNTTTSSSNTNNTSGANSSLPASRPLQNVIPTCVYLMSRVAVHMEIEGTAQCPTQVMLAAALGCEELGIANKLLAQSIFGLWMTSALLEIQLKSHHRPYAVRVAWQSLLDKFSHANPIEKKYDEPMIMLKRNVFFSKRDEEKIKDHRILELLYEEAKSNVLLARYIMEPVHSMILGGIQARIELGPYNPHIHTISFFRENQLRFLPQHVAKSSSWYWLPVSRKNSPEVKLLEQFKRSSQTATTKSLIRSYLEFCWALPFYGAAFFQGQVEQPVHGLMSLANQKDVDVIIAINERGLFVIDPEEYTLILGLRYEDFSWDFAKPSASDDPDCQTCIFIQFDATENGVQMSKLMQIFSKQAVMMDALISHFAEQMRKRKLEGNTVDQFHDEPNLIQSNGNGVLCNKLSRLILATFDEEGRCIGQMGSLSISY